MSRNLISNVEEVSYESIAMELSTVASPSPDPLDALIALEEYLMEHYGLTFMQAVRAGVRYQTHKH